jgi:hypothetical protein
MGAKWRQSPKQSEGAYGDFNPNAVVRFLQEELGWRELGNEQYLRDHFNHGVPLSEGAYFFLAPPRYKVEKRRLMIVQARLKELPGQAENHQLKLRLWIVCRDSKCNEGCPGKPEIRLYGFRFDSPETGDGRNRYFHVQLLNDPARRGEEDLLCIPWLDANHPAIPVLAKDMGEVILCLAAGLYGAEGLRELQTIASGRLRGAIDEYIRLAAEK